MENGFWRLGKWHALAALLYLATQVRPASIESIPEAVGAVLAAVATIAAATYVFRGAKVGFSRVQANLSGE